MSLFCHQSCLMLIAPAKLLCFCLSALPVLTLMQIASSYPTAILIRERALVINMESVRMIVCQDYVLLQKVPAPHFDHVGFPTPESPFVMDLKTRLSHSGMDSPE